MSTAQSQLPPAEKCGAIASGFTATSRAEVTPRYPL